MKLNIMKKFVAIFICLLIAFGSLASINSFAALSDIEIQGSSYQHVLKAKTEYKVQHPEDPTEYVCYSLIAKEALNIWGDVIAIRGLASEDNWFLTGDKNQNWAPSIIMEKADYEKTNSYFNKNAVTNDQIMKNEYASLYIGYQANRIIYYGDIISILKDECDFIRKTFGPKYNKALWQVERYISCLNFRHLNHRYLTMANPARPGTSFTYQFKIM